MWQRLCTVLLSNNNKNCLFPFFFFGFGNQFRPEQRTLVTETRLISCHVATFAESEQACFKAQKQTVAERPQRGRYVPLGFRQLRKHYKALLHHKPLETQATHLYTPLARNNEEPYCAFAELRGLSRATKCPSPARYAWL
jgi:hypothetical protein